ncbi:MAG TPA: glycosyltransferase [Ktedonobacteraceae bacterium]|nr:glycosyltransferase [Ktedonobacteraceae bacterium]
MMCVSVVVPTFKRPTLLARCLEALLAQDFAPIEYEVIIVDDAVSDLTRCQVEQYAKRAEIRGHTIRYFAATNSHGPAAARNIGLYAAYGEIIAFTDDDCIPSPGWLKAGVVALTDNVVAVAGHIIVPLPPAPTDYEYNASSLAHSEFVTANCFVRRTALISIGGFDERFTAAWREDSDLIFTLQELGAHCIAAQDAVVIHPIRSAQWGVSIHQQRKSIFNALLYKKHPILYRQKIQATPPWHYYAIVCALLVIMIGAISESLLLVCIALGTWIYLTCRFCLERLQYTSHTPSHITEMIVTSFVIPLLAIFWRLRGAIKFRVFFL